MALALHSTLSGKKEALNKKPGDTVGIYTCGPTVYHYAHIGNMRSFVFSDLLKRALVYSDYKVRHVMNITDVGHLAEATGEDTIEREAKKEKKSAQEIAHFYTDAFMADLKALNVDTATMDFPRASMHIEEQVALIRKLEEKGFTYKTTDGIYFDTSKDEGYGVLAHLDRTKLMEGARVEKNVAKLNPSDFALWKFSTKEEKREQEWESPWGTGFPGWHIECSAMSMKYLGEHFDIHTGGIDLIFPHHTNEIAQSENATGKKFVDIWMHTGFLNEKGSKMSRSVGNIETVSELVKKGFDPLDYRFLLLGTHYRKPLEWSDEAIEGARNAHNKLKDQCVALGNESGSVHPGYVTKFKEALEDDLNTPQALALVWTMLQSPLSAPDKKATLLDFDRVLGLSLARLKAEPLPPEVIALIEKREKARKEKDWKRSDELRIQIEKLGWTVKDTDSGPVAAKRRS